MITKLPGWELCSLPNGRPYMEKVFNGFQLRIIEHTVQNYIHGTGEKETGILGFIDGKMALATYDLLVCAASLVDWTKAEGLKGGQTH